MLPSEVGAEPIEPVGHEHEFDRNCFASTCCAALRIESLAQLSMQLASLPVPTPISLDTYVRLISTYKLTLLFLLRLALGFLSSLPASWLR